MKKFRNIFNRCMPVIVALSVLFAFTACGGYEEEDSDVVILRVANWEEYIDEGDWDEEEYIELEDGTVICGINEMTEDFEEWYYETYGKRVEVQYSTFGTNEELYNQMTLGDVYDLVCPSEYMIMKLMNEGKLCPFSEEFFDADNENNYYVRNVSPFIRKSFDDLSINGDSLTNYAAGYMWGTLGIVYNPEYVTKEQASNWNILLDSNLAKQITIKDSVRDAYIAAAAIYAYDEITADDFLNSPDYYERLSEVINATDPETVDGVEEILSEIRKNVYAFEVDSGKADMVSGKVLANQQWSGDAVFTLDQAEEDGVELCYTCPEEATNLWFDGWVMLNDGIGEDAEKQQAAEAFINFVSRPDNAVRNMYYIGYTSVISGADSGIIKGYLDYCYAADEETEDIIEYDISYFFGTETVVEADASQTDRQLGAQYPTEETMSRAVIMSYFDDECNERINRMWTNVRCYDLNDLFN